MLQQLQQPVRHGHGLPPVGPALRALLSTDPHQQRPCQPPLFLGVQPWDAHLQEDLGEVLGEGAAAARARPLQHGGAGHLQGAVRAEPLQEVGAALDGLVCCAGSWW